MRPSPLHGARPSSLRLEPKRFIRLEGEGHWLWSVEATGRVVEFIGQTAGVLREP